MLIQSGPKHKTEQTFSQTPLNRRKASAPQVASRSSKDKQLRGITLQNVLEKRRLEQALNIKEFAVLAGISYSAARAWFRLPAFPVFQGIVFWQDFVQWRTAGHAAGERPERLQERESADPSVPSGLPARALRILLEA